MDGILLPLRSDRGSEWVHVDFFWDPSFYIVIDVMFVSPHCKNKMAPVAYLRERLRESE